MGRHRVRGEDGELVKRSSNPQTVLPSEGFEKSIIHLLPRQGLQLQHTGGSGDEDVDAIGTAPLSPVLSSRVAVQIERSSRGQTHWQRDLGLYQRNAPNRP
ncbi:restriction endonuclease [Corynebacterium anserum]|nr:restriction endonuclease [Corynebacterium anserum]